MKHLRFLKYERHRISRTISTWENENEAQFLLLILHVEKYLKFCKKQITFFIYCNYKLAKAVAKALNLFLRLYAEQNLLVKQIAPDQYEYIEKEIPARWNRYL